MRGGPGPQSSLSRVFRAPFPVFFWPLWALMIDYRTCRSRVEWPLKTGSRVGMPFGDWVCKFPADAISIVIPGHWPIITSQLLHRLAGSSIHPAIRRGGPSQVRQREPAPFNTFEHSRPFEDQPHRISIRPHVRVTHAAWHFN